MVQDPGARIGLQVDTAATVEVSLQETQKILGNGRIRSVVCDAPLDSRDPQRAEGG